VWVDAVCKAPREGGVMANLLVSVNVPPGIGVEQFKAGSKILASILQDIRGSEQSMRGYLHAASMDGFPVSPMNTPKEQLEELCIRAFWWAFEEILSGKLHRGGRGHQV